MTNLQMSNRAHTPQTFYLHHSKPTVNFGDFSEMRKTLVISSSTFAIFGFLKILHCKVSNPWVILVVLCCSRRYERSGGNPSPFGPPSHRERDDVARVALWTCRRQHDPVQTLAPTLIPCCCRARAPLCVQHDSHTLPSFLSPSCGLE